MRSILGNAVVIRAVNIMLVCAATPLYGRSFTELIIALAAVLKKEIWV